MRTLSLNLFFSLGSVYSFKHWKIFTTTYYIKFKNKRKGSLVNWNCSKAKSLFVKFCLMPLQKLYTEQEKLLLCNVQKFYVQKRKRILELTISVDVMNAGLKNHTLCCFAFHATRLSKTFYNYPLHPFRN